MTVLPVQRRPVQAVRAVYSTGGCISAQNTLCAVLLQNMILCLYYTWHKFNW